MRLKLVLGPMVVCWSRGVPEHRDRPDVHSRPSGVKLVTILREYELRLRSPIIPSAGPLTENLDNVKRMEDTQTGVCHFSLFFRNRTSSLHAPIASKSAPINLEVRPASFQHTAGPAHG